MPAGSASESPRTRPVGVDPGDAGAGGFGELVKLLPLGCLSGSMSAMVLSFFGELLAELLGERLLDALGDEIIDRDQREGENRHQAQNELTEDARGQASLWHWRRAPRRTPQSCTKAWTKARLPSLR